ncbi:hypothetical protein [Beijerinckia sp. L45]|uniref:hypothetical protein n=1 Tax=Beijerinckia sp. L45 TaxID=1641855 RepID=UPI00131CD07F|nr:hypothetical protein [Beijerinckia sp. L45]
MIDWAINRDFIGPTCQVVSVSGTGRMTGYAIDHQVTTISIEGTDTGKIEVCLNRDDRRGDATCYAAIDDEVVGAIFAAGEKW